MGIACAKVNPETACETIWNRNRALGVTPNRLTLFHWASFAYHFAANYLKTLLAVAGGRRRNFSKICLLTSKLNCVP